MTIEDTFLVFSKDLFFNFMLSPIDIVLGDHEFTLLSLYLLGG